VGGPVPLEDPPGKDLARRVIDPDAESRLVVVATELRFKKPGA
jgi:hypothetical protein